MAPTIGSVTSNRFPYPPLSPERAETVAVSFTPSIFKRMSTRAPKIFTPVLQSSAVFRGLQGLSLLHPYEIRENNLLACGPIAAPLAVLLFGLGVYWYLNQRGIRPTSVNEIERVHPIPLNEFYP